MSAGKYIEAYDDKLARERLEELFKSKGMLRLQEDLTRVCNEYYKEDEGIPEQKITRGLRTKINPIDESIVTKDTFHTNFRQLNGECLNAYIDERGNNSSALEGINYAFKFIEERSK
jgi:hypothetical protein